MSQFASAISGIKNVADVAMPVVNTILTQRNWREQKQMANTVYQRSMKDMLAAGLNPILAAGGSSAATPAAPVVDASPRSSSSARELWESRMAKDQADKMYYDAAASGAQADILTKEAAMRDQELKLFPTILKERIKSQQLTNKVSSAQAAKIEQDKTAQELDNVERKVGAGIYESKGIGVLYKAIKELFR